MVVAAKKFTEKDRLTVPSVILGTTLKRRKCCIPDLTKLLEIAKFETHFDKPIFHNREH